MKKTHPANARIHHYTSLDALALILKNRTIRFNRLDRVNDPLECKSSTYTKLQKIIFASCWTHSDDESIPLWKLYSEQRGVRISMPQNMFKGRHNNRKIYSAPCYSAFRVDEHYELRDNKGRGFTGQDIYGPCPINYVPEVELDYPFQGPDDLYDLGLAGLRKSEVWQFESETRFRILGTFAQLDQEHNAFISPTKLNDLELLQEHIDIPLAQSAIEEMVITKHPSFTTSDNIVLEALLSKYAPKALAFESKILFRDK